MPYPPGEMSWESIAGLPDPIGTLGAIPRHNSCRHAFIFKPGVNHRSRSGCTIASANSSRDESAIRSLRTFKCRLRRRVYAGRRCFLVRHTRSAKALRVCADELPGPIPASEVPARWVRVEASIGAQVVGRAHGDDRGEFLLILDSEAAGLGELPSPLIAQVEVFGPAAPVPIPANDPLGDLPLETLAADPDDVSPGEKLPPGYASTASSSRQVTFQLGKLLTGQEKFFFNP